MRSCAAAAAGAAAGGATGPSSQPADNTSQPADKKLKTIPTQPLGRTGVQITRLMMGASFPEYGPRLLRFAYVNGIRAFDNSSWYVGGKGESLLGAFVNQISRRDEVFIMTKKRTEDPDEWYQAALVALEKMKVDTLDVFMVHGVEDPAIVRDREGQWGKMKDRLIREKRIRFMGFSTHAEMPARVACLTEVTKGGWADVAIVACDPGLIRSHDAFNKALDVCAEAGLGLIAMKTGRGLGRAATQPAEIGPNPFAGLGLTPHGAMHAGIWSDERFAAVCTEMPNRRIIEENSEGARQFRKPFDAKQWQILDDGIKRLSRATCPGCDGSCREAAGTKTDFCSIARYLAYYEEDGNRELARRLYRSLSREQRDWQGADLKAASRACCGRLDFEAILERARQLLV